MRTRPRATARVTELWLLMGALAACEGFPPPDPSGEPTTGGSDGTETSPSTTAPTGDDGCAAPAVRLGTGADAFEALSEGDPLVLVHGPQGGWHVDVSVQVRGLGEVVVLAATLREVGTGVQLGGDQPDAYVTLSPMDACWGEHVGLRTYVDDPEDVDQSRICGWSGAPLTLSVAVADARSGTSLEAEVPVVGALDAYDEPVCE